MSQPVGSHGKFIQAIAHFEEHKQQSRLKFDSIIQKTDEAAKSSSSRKNSSRLRSFKVILDQELPDLEDLQGLSKLVSGFLESLTKELTQREQILDNGYRALNKSNAAERMNLSSSLPNFYLCKAMSAQHEKPAEDIPLRQPSPQQALGIGSSLPAASIHPELAEILSPKNPFQEEEEAEEEYVAVSPSPPRTQAPSPEAQAERNFLVEDPGEVSPSFQEPTFLVEQSLMMRAAYFSIGATSGQAASR